MQSHREPSLHRQFNADLKFGGVTQKCLSDHPLFVPFSVAFNGMAKQLNDLREKFDEELKIRGINLNKEGWTRWHVFH